MAPPNETPARKRRLSRPIILGWLGVFLGCAGLWGIEALSNRARHRFQTEQRERNALRDQLSDHLYSDFAYFKVSRQKLEDDLNGGRPFARLADAAPQMPRYRWDPATLGPQYAGWKVELTCRSYGDAGSAVEEVVSATTVAPPARYRSPASTQASAELETTRHVALIAGIGAWFVALLTLFFSQPWRRQIAQVCIAGTLVAAVAWSVSPDRMWNRASLVAPLPIGIAAAGMIGFLALLLPARRPKPATAAGRCAGCGYDLTGNESGICPECGRPTLRNRVERWNEQAERLQAVADEREATDRQIIEWTGRFSDPESTRDFSPSPGTRGEGWGEGINPRLQAKALTLSLARTTGRGDQSSNAML